MYQEEGLFTYFVDPWISERDRRFAIDKEVEFRDSQLCQSMKPIKPIVYGKLHPLTNGYLLWRFYITVIGCSFGKCSQVVSIAKCGRVGVCFLVETSEFVTVSFINLSFVIGMCLLLLIVSFQSQHC